MIEAENLSNVTFPHNRALVGGLPTHDALLLVDYVQISHQFILLRKAGLSASGGSAKIKVRDQLLYLLKLKILFVPIELKHLSEPSLEDSYCFESM